MVNINEASEREDKRRYISFLKHIDIQIFKCCGPFSSKLYVYDD